MNHDELLAKIKSLDGALIFYDGRPTIEGAGKGDKVNGALRAVVELSKPYLAGEVYVNPEFNQGVMAAFRLVIDAIEKELK